MTIVRCPRCRDEVTVPPGATARAIVRCPLCLEQYLLAEALANAPPPLVIIGGEVETAAIAQPDNGSEYRVADGLFPAALEATARPAVMLPRPVLKTKPRPRRKEKSGLVLLVNYIVGGVMGLALGLLVLWWGFRKDPLEVGPQFAQYVPWIVPPQFHAKLDNGRAVSPPVSVVNEKKPSKVSQTAAAALPGEEEPAKLPEESPSTVNEATTELTNNAPPMPDLTDLLPDGLPEKAKLSP